MAIRDPTTGRRVFGKEARKVEDAQKAVTRQRALERDIKLQRTFEVTTSTGGKIFRTQAKTDRGSIVVDSTAPSRISAPTIAGQQKIQAISGGDIKAFTIKEGAIKRNVLAEKAVQTQQAIARDQKRKQLLVTNAPIPLILRKVLEPKKKTVVTEVRKIRIPEKGISDDLTVLLSELSQKPIRGKGKFAFKVLKEVLPFVNTESQSAYKKFFSGRKQKLTGFEKLNVLFDAVSVLTLGSGGLVLTGAKLVGKGVPILVKSGILFGKVGKIKNVSKLGKIAGKSRFINKLSNLPNIGKISTINFAVSVVDDLGFSKRMFEAGKEFYQVNDALLKRTAETLGNKNKEEFLSDYNGFVSKELKDHNLNWRDYANFVGITTGSEKHIRNAQSKFSKYLINSGFSPKDARLILANIENARRGRAIGQLFGLTKIEISSDKLVNRLIAKGVGKRKAIGVGVAREAVSTLVSESYVQGGNFNPNDLFLAVAIGLPYSLWASKTKIKVVPPKIMKKATNRIVRNITKRLSVVRANKYADKMIKQSAKEQGRKLNNLQVKSIRVGLSKQEKKRLVSDYVKNVMLVNRKRVLRPSRVKQKVLLRDPIVNIIDPFEFLGDKVQDISDVVKKRLVKSFKKKVPKEIKVKPKVKAKVKAKIRAKVKAKIKVKAKAKPKLTAKARAIIRARARAVIRARARAKAKPKPKPRPKPRPRPRPKPKPRPRPKPKPRPKPRPRPRPKPKPRPKPRPRPRPKPKPRPKIIIPKFNLPMFIRSLGKGERVAYNVLIKKKGKFTKVKVWLPKNRAKQRIIDLVNAGKIDSGKIFPVGKTKKKDIGSLTLKKIVKKKNRRKK